MQLVINTPGTMITQKDGIFRLKQNDRRFDISPLKVESIVLTNKALLSSQAVSLALEHSIDIIFLDGYGDPVGRIWFSKLGSTALIRRRQLAAEINEELGLKLVSEMIQQKINNQNQFLKKLMYSRPNKTEIFAGPLDSIKQASKSLDKLTEKTTDNIRNRLMGVEGTCGRAYFQCISKLLPEKYQFERRSRQPAKDPFNAVLNYCYGILYSRVEKACILAGLDPYVGFLHTDNYNKKSLVFDLIEPFRIFAEQVTVYLFTGRKINDAYFDIRENAVSLNQTGKPVVIETMNTHLDETVRYRRKNVKRCHIIQHEAHRLANILLSDDTEKRPDWLEIKEF
jgi:CRISPR-associated protein Cas1